MTEQRAAQSRGYNIGQRGRELALYSEHAHIPMSEFGLINAWLSKPPVDNKGFVISPGVTNSPAWSHYVADKAAPDFLAFEQRADANTFGLVGFGRILNLAGFSQNPIGYVASDPEVQQSRISDQLLKGLVVAAKQLCPIMRKHLPDAGIAFRRAANTGAQLFSTKASLKGKALRHLLANFNRFVELVEADDYRSIRIEFGASTLAMVRRRHQSDSVEVRVTSGRIAASAFKERRVSDGKGGFIIADKRLPDEYSQFMCGNRERKVIAIDFIYNMFEVIVSSLWRYVAAAYPHHWHVGNALDELRKYPGLYRDRRPKACDVRNYDAHQPLTLLDYQTDVLCDEMHLPEWYRKISKITNSPPLLSPPTWKDGSDGVHLDGDPDHPFEGRESRALGLPSGKGLTAAWHGKFANGIACWVAWMLVLNLPLDADNLLRYLTFDPSMPVWAWNCGDDVCFWFDRTITEAQEKAFISTYSSLCSCWAIDWDEYPSFLSYQIRWSETLGSWTAYPDAARGLTNIFDRESSLPRLYQADRLPNHDTLRRAFGLDGIANPDWMAASNQFACFGFFERSKLYRARNPAWAEIEDLYLWHLDKFKQGARRMLEDAAAFEESALSEISVFTGNALDPMLLANPHYVYFRPEYEEYLAPDSDELIQNSERSVLFVYISPEDAKPITAAMAA